MNLIMEEFLREREWRGVEATPKTLIGGVLETPVHMKRDTWSPDPVDQNVSPARHVLRSSLPPSAEYIDLKQTALRLVENQRTIQDLTGEKRELGDKLRVEVGRATEYQRQVLDLKAENDQVAAKEELLKSQLVNLEKALQLAENTRLTSMKENADLTTELLTLRTRLARREEELNKYKDKTGGVKKSLREAKETLQARENEEEKIEASHEVQVSRYEQEQVEELSKMQQELEQHRRLWASAQHTVKQLEAELERERQRLSTLDSDRAALKSRMSTMGLAMPRYAVFPWMLAFFLGVLLSYLPWYAAQANTPLIS